MNLLLLESSEVSGDIAELRGRRARHLVEVLGVEPGRRVRAAIVDRGRVEVTVTAVAPGAVQLRLGTVLESARRPGPVRVILALPRPKALRRLLRDLASLGVARLDLVNAWKVPRSYFQSSLISPEALRRELLIGAEQGGQVFLPRVEVHRLLVPFLEEAASTDHELRFVAHPRAEAALRPTEGLGPGDPVTLAVGPEGGWTEAELDSFRESGFVPVRLHDAVLRSPVAVVVFLGQIDLLRRIGESGSVSP